MNPFVKWGAASGGLLSILTLYGFLGGPTPVFSGDLRKLDCKYAPAAVAAFTAQQQNLLAIKPAEDPRSQNAWKALLEQAERDLNTAIDHRIKCDGR